jgi:hypothetical protein
LFYNKINNSLNYVLILEINYAALKEHQVVKSALSLSRKQQSVRHSKQNQKRGMVLPFEPQYITFDEVTYSVDMPKVIYKQNKIANVFLGPIYFMKTFSKNCVDFTQ